MTVFETQIYQLYESITLNMVFSTKEDVFQIKLARPTNANLIYKNLILDFKGETIVDALLRSTS